MAAAPARGSTATRNRVRSGCGSAPPNIFDPRRGPRLDGAKMPRGSPESEEETSRKRGRNLPESEEETSRTEVSDPLGRGPRSDTDTARKTAAAGRNIVLFPSFSPPGSCNVLVCNVLVSGALNLEDAPPSVCAAVRDVEL